MRILGDKYAVIASRHAYADFGVRFECGKLLFQTDAEVSAALANGKATGLVPCKPLLHTVRSADPGYITVSPGARLPVMSPKSAT